MLKITKLPKLRLSKPLFYYTIYCLAFLLYHIKLV